MTRSEKFRVFAAGSVRATHRETITWMSDSRRLAIALALAPLLYPVMFCLFYLQAYHLRMVSAHVEEMARILREIVDRGTPQ